MKLKLLISLIALSTGSQALAMDRASDFKERKVSAEQKSLEAKIFDWSAIADTEVEPEESDYGPGDAKRQDARKKTKAQHDTAFDCTGFPAEIQVLVKQWVTEPMEFFDAITHHTFAHNIKRGFNAPRHAIVIKNNKFVVTDKNTARICSINQAPHSRESALAEDIVLEGHTADVIYIAELPNGTIATGSQDRTVRVWNQYTGECIKTLEGHETGIRALLATPQGTLIAAQNSHEGHSIYRVWNPETGELKLTISTEASFLNGRALPIITSNNLLALCSTLDIHLYNYTTGALVRTIRAHEDVIYGITNAPNGDLVSVGQDRIIKVWDAETGHMKHSIRGENSQEPKYHFQTITCLPDTTIAATGRGNIALIYQPTTNTCLAELVGKEENSHMHIAHLGARYILASYTDATIKIWDKVTKECVYTMNVAGKTSMLQVTADGIILFTDLHGAKLYKVDQQAIAELSNLEFSTQERLKKLIAYLSSQHEIGIKKTLEVPTIPLHKVDTEFFKTLPPAIKTCLLSHFKIKFLVIPEKE